MSTQLAALGIDVIEGYEAAQLELRPDVFVIGNVMSRGNALIEAILDSGRPYESGPEWLARNVLAGRWVLGVAGTHGKTTTTSLLTWILEHAGLDPGFLVGGVPLGLQRQRATRRGPPLRVEADEYDTAFFDKRAKFVHYRPRTAILNNLEHDHADIYPDVASIQRQFHLLLWRTVPGNGRLIVNAADRHLAEVLAMGCWTPVERFTADATAPRTGAWWPIRRPDTRDSRSCTASGTSATSNGTRSAGTTRRTLSQRSSRRCTRASTSRRRSKRCAGSAASDAGWKVRGTVNGIVVYDDFAHHPTAITTTLEGVRRKAGEGRVIAVLEPRSNTMKLGTHKAALAESLRGADRVFVYQSPEVRWDVAEAMQPLGELAVVHDDLAQLTAALVAATRPGDQVVLMSNGSFGGLHDRLLAASRRARDGLESA